MTKLLTQGIFKGPHGQVLSAVVDDDGRVIFYWALKQKLMLDRCFYKADRKRMDQCLTIDYDYNTTRWKHSAIDRE